MDAPPDEDAIFLTSAQPNRRARVLWRELAIALAAVLLSWAVVTLILACSFPLERLLGEKGLTALERLMGVLLAMIAVQMLVDGAREVFA